MIKPEKFLVYLFYCCAIWVVVSISCAFFRSAHAGIRGEIKINLELKESSNDPDTIIFFGELPNKNYVPAGQELAAIASFETTVITVKCSYDYILKCAEMICEEKKYSGYGLINLKRPNIITTCYQTDIVFFIALK